MNVTVTFADTEIVLAVEVAPDMTVGDFQAYVLEEAGFKSNPGATLFHNNRQLNSSQTLQQASIHDNDMIIVSTGDSTAGLSSNAGARSGRHGSNASASGVINEDALNAQIEAARQQILYEPQLFTQLSRQSPDLAQALHDSAAFRKAYRKLYDEQLQLKAENQEIDRNFEMAMEEMPEAFATVTMLFANIEVNGVPVKAFIDSGAQTTIMSPDCAERCNLSHLIDKRHRGMAYGVGQAKILGRIHMAPIKIGSSYFACAMTVIEGTNMEFLLGLDMLKHHQAVIDLREKKLRMGDEELPFLGDAELPQNMGIPGAAVPGSAVPGSAVPAASVSDNTKGAAPSSSQAQAGPSSSSLPQVAPVPGAARPAGPLGPIGPSVSPLRSSGFTPGIQVPGGAPSQPQQGVPLGQAPLGQPPNQRVAQASAHTQRAPSLAQYDPAVVANLTNLGFSSSQVLKALNKADGNPDIAAALLFDE